MAEKNSFDHLVSGLSSEERKQMLEKMQATRGDPEKESLALVDIAADEGVSAEAQLKNESFLFRLWLWIKSLITNTPAATLYNAYQVGAIARNLDRVSPGLVDFRRKSLATVCFNRLNELKKAADFFKPYCALIDAAGDFYVFLGIQGMPQVAEQMAKEVDPYSIPLDKGAKPEQRVSLLRRMDEVMANIPQEQKTMMYECARASEWLLQLTKLPFNTFLSHFNTMIEGECTCPFAVARTDIDEFVRVLCNGQSVPNEVLESLYLYYHEKARGRQVGSAPDSAESFIEKAHAQIAAMHTFITSVPLRLVGRVVYDNAYWSPGTIAAAEDWFVKYKMGWKRLFDQKWEAWSNDCKKEIVRQTLKRSFDIDQFPRFPARPWARFGLPFRYELTGGFLCWYFRAQFPLYVPTFKTVQTEGDFMKKDNLTDFSEALDVFAQVGDGLDTVCRTASDSGDLGAAFKKWEAEPTAQNQQKAEQALHMCEADVGHLLSRFGEASRKMGQVLTGLTGYASDSQYDSLHNIDEICGKDNALFRKRLQDAKDSLDHAFAIVKELEPVDTPSMKK